MDRNNPHTKLLYDKLITAVFHGPDCYISPSVYQNKNTLPTWNYIKVHISGRCDLIDSVNQLKQSIVDMINILEGSNPKFDLEADNALMDQFIHYIVGFKIEIENWEGKYKLSQDKNIFDIEHAKAMLIEHTSSSKASYLQKIYE